MAQIVAALIGLYAANQSSKNAKKLASQQKSLTDVQADIAKSLHPIALNFYKDSRAAYDPAFRYFSDITSPDPSRRLAAAAPELRTIDTKYDGVLKTAGSLAPRSTASAGRAAGLSFRAADDKQALMASLRRGGFDQLLSLSQLAGNLGAGAVGGSTGAAGMASNSLTASYGAANAARGQQTAAYAELGRSLAEMFGQDDQSWYVGSKRGRG